MPNYHFICDACGASFEEQLPMGSTVPPCASCKSANVRKIIKAPMVHFKGSGFYKTDSKGIVKSSLKESKPVESVETKTIEKKPDALKPDTPKKPDSAPKKE